MTADFSTNALTIDVEDYYHVSAFEGIVQPEAWDRLESRVERNTHRLLEILAAAKVNATFFVLGWVAERQPGLVRAIREQGHEIACHGYSHRRIYRQTVEEFRAETRKAKTILEDLAGTAVIGYRAASYSITRQTLWALDILMEEGFRYDSSIFPVYHDLYGIPDHPRFWHRYRKNGLTLIEFPPTTIRLGRVNIPVAGGGYLRFFPYAFTRWAIERINAREGQGAVVYLHPWEIDPEQPRLPAAWRSRLRHYLNLSRTESILERLLAHFRFSPLGEIHRALAD